MWKGIGRLAKKRWRLYMAKNWPKFWRWFLFLLQSVSPFIPVIMIFFCPPLLASTIRTGAGQKKHHVFGMGHQGGPRVAFFIGCSILLLVCFDTGGRVS